ncbi:uncharacterized protein LOC135502154 [Lineus longissimus]|uniref:uncharacterized protein LOC135502154 n=1 Tax=Lineus longissimus TaxID=88925 RepID=UPI002B4E8B70
MDSDSTRSTAELQKFLDNQMYTTRVIRQFELIFGETFASNGGSEASSVLASYLNLAPGKKCLDVGCGLGGHAFYLAKHHGVEVHGLDLCNNMVNLARKYANERYKDARLSFAVEDVTTFEFPDESFDVIYSQGVMPHIQDKLSLFKKFRTWLKPGGRLFITGFTCSSGNHSKAFKDYIAQRRYHILTVEQYAKVLESAGFKTVVAKDYSDVFARNTRRELARLESIKEDFIKEFGREEYDLILQRWLEKIQRNQEGEQGYGLFVYEK